MPVKMPPLSPSLSTAYSSNCLRSWSCKKTLFSLRNRELLSRAIRCVSRYNPEVPVEKEGSLDNSTRRFFSKTEWKDSTASCVNTSSFKAIPARDNARATPGVPQSHPSFNNARGEHLAVVSSSKETPLYQ